ncbi:transcriptional regulator domain-containing protein [Croceicoccus naphthovorans]|uniref:transcriptional regulator domain-containing protein n=2 Tax=Sphingomonadales TaxID=204457 RepID=UPI00296F076A
MRDTGRGAMPTASDWRSQAIAGATANFDYADFAQEFLRHNKNYRRDYDRMTSTSADGAHREETLSADFVRRWGLVFPHRPLCVGRSRARAMATRRRARHSRAGASAPGLCRRACV